MGLLDALGLVKTPVAAAKKAPAAVASGPAATPTPQVGSASGGTVGDMVQQGAFTIARVAAVVLIEALKAHPQAAAIQAFITQSNTKLATADGHAGKSEWPQAMQALEDVKAIAATAKKAADDRQAFTVKLADVTMGMNAYQRFDNALFNLLSAAIGNANAQAAANNYVAANATLDAAAAQLQAKLKAWVDTVNGMLAKSTANASVGGFLKPEIDKARVQVAAANTALGARRWSEGVMAAVTALRALSATERMAPRRAAYETARVATVAQIAKVKGAAPVADRGPGLDALLADADQSASRAVMQFEAGEAKLRDINARCDRILAAAADTEAYKRQRPLADAELAALDKHAAAARIAPAREAARKQLEQAAKAAAGAATAADPGPGWAAASNEVVRVRADLAAAKVLADGAGSAAGAEAAAANPADVATMKTALQKLRADQLAAAAAPFAAEAAAPLKSCKEQIDKADKALAKNDGKGAAGPLSAAAKALIEAKAVQVAQSQFKSTLPGVEARLTSLQALPRAALLKGVIDPVAKALADARAKNKANSGVEAMAALRRAADLAAAAVKADLDRGKFDTAAAATATHVATITDAKAKKPLDTALADAKKLADAFKFGEAMAALKKLEVSIDKAELMTRAAANPADPAIAALAAKMTANGGEKEVDDLVQSPKTTDPRMIAALATGRFGVTMVPDTSASAAPHEAKSMKALCKTFAMVPQDVKSFGSISKITHTDSTGGSGAWSTNTTVTLSGRPDLHKQGLGPGLTAKDTTGATVKQLPADVDKDCLPVGGDSEYVSFTALHEVGHGVDDARTYMQRNGAREDHGGWQVHGAGVQAIANAVGPHIRSKVGGSNTFYSKPEDKKYVLDKLLNQKPARPATVAAGSDDAKAYDAFDRWHRLATSDGIWGRQGDAEEIAIGGKTVYHEAYPREWVSYLLAARKKGLTGYQFRAPAEWFAELYAGFKSKKLGAKHPAQEWLKKL
ncbi:MAG TPA: hypothetical protein VHM00_13160 [Caldimonas sp.]|nr:hypothetical protein [Caldimonas sp.]HEX2542019.1 hypothetical protein [Caldimonas sp.]